LWMFLDCLIGASLFFLIKRRFNLLTENLTAVSRNLLIIIAAIPFVTFVVTFWDVVIIEELY
jgi:hypothetical protein